MVTECACVCVCEECVLQPSVCRSNSVSGIKAVEKTLMSVKEIKQEERS